MQDHPRNCHCYYCYLKSPQWEREKREAWKLLKASYCQICKHFGPSEWHHYKGYEAIWTEKDHSFITLVCRSCHQRCHFTLSGKKIPLTREALEKRYKMLKWTYPIRSFRPSTFFSWLYKSYRV